MIYLLLLIRFSLSLNLLLLQPVRVIRSSMMFCGTFYMLVLLVHAESPLPACNLVYFTKKYFIYLCQT